MRARIDVTRSLSLFLAAVLSVGIASSASTQSAAFSDPDSLDRGGVTGAGLTEMQAGWWQAVTEDLTREEYSPTPSLAGFEAQNRAHNLRTTFDQGGIDVAPRTDEASAPGWRFAWHTSALGRAGNMQDAAPASPRANGARVTYERDGWSEWYENSPKGLEQGFTIGQRPAGEGPLRIAGSIAGGLEPRASSDGAIDFIDDCGACVIRYGELHVWDARGTVLQSHLAVQGLEVAIVIDDAEAQYPLTIDPLVTSPSWTAEANLANSYLGFSVSTAGDVNGDGFSDVIVGSWGYTNGQTNEGRAFVYHGSASGLSVTPNWTAEANQANSRFAYSVATAGDVNGDKFDDVIVGAAHFTNGETTEGMAFVYLGSASGLSSTPSWTAEGNQSFAEFGASVSTAGDVNADGFADVIVGSQFFDNGQDGEGHAFVYHGSASGLSVAPNWTAEGNAIGIQLGCSVSAAGDVNGDGFGDVIMGALVYSNGQTNEGRAFVYHGSQSGLNTTPSWSAESNQANAYFGVSVAGAGDVNGDGYADVIVGAQGFSNGQSAEGRAFVYHGASGGLLLAPSWTGEINIQDASLGHTVATAGDVNGDGYADVIVGAMNVTNGQFAEGQAIVYVGSSFGLQTFSYWTSESNQASANYGISVATAGDVNGDGFSDVIVGAWFYDSGQPNEGRAFVYHGSAGGLMVILQWAVNGEQDQASLGYSVATAGDVNGDGYSDVIVGARAYDNGQSGEGRAFVYHGSATGLSSTPNWIAESDQASASFGLSVATAGDVNGDGFSDVIVGAPFFDGGQQSEGRAYVYHGSPAGLNLTPSWIAESNQEDAKFGISVATAGDVNGDGYADVIVGAQGEISPFANQEGRAFVYHGSTTGLATAAAWIEECDQVGATFGGSVSTAGDVNGDGYSDVIVGAYSYSNGESEEGRAFGYHGSPTGLGPVIWTAESDQDFVYMGYSVSTAGDVNADGFSDVIVGAPEYDVGGNFAGRAFVYHGSPTGLGIANWTADGPQSNADFGRSVAGAGDVNGDGYSDVIVGAPYYDGALTNVGRALVYQGSSIGLSSSDAWTASINQADAHTGASVATAGDINGDGFSDVIVGVPEYDAGQAGEGSAIAIFGNERRGLDRVPRQTRTDGSAPIAVLGASDSPTGFQLQALGRTAGGRGRVRLQYEVKPFGTPFNGSALVVGDPVDTGAPTLGTGSAVALSKLVGGLTPDTLYRWRLRVVSDSPFFPRSPWFSLAANGAGEADLRTADAATSVAGAPVTDGLSASWLGPAAPNPFSLATELAFTLPDRGPVRLAVFDVSGREVAVLVDEAHAAGRHVVRWDGRGEDRRAMPAGVYLARLEFAGRVEGRKLVLAR
ncbi:MAG: FG-GAP-like repeat-containing protein [bacterium]